VPLHLRNAATGLMKNIGYGKGYQYGARSGRQSCGMTCLPESLAGKTYYHPTDQGFEARLRQPHGGDTASQGSPEASNMKSSRFIAVRNVLLIPFCFPSLFFPLPLQAQDNLLFKIDESVTRFAFSGSGRITFFRSPRIFREKVQLQRDDIWIAERDGQETRILQGDKICAWHDAVQLYRAWAALVAGRMKLAPNSPPAK